MSEKLPPTKLERDRLITERHRSLPRPGMAPAPRGFSSAMAIAPDRSEAMRRENRIREIDKSLNRAKGKLTRDFGRSRLSLSIV